MLGDSMTYSAEIFDILRSQSGNIFYGVRLTVSRRDVNGEIGPSTECFVKRGSTGAGFTLSGSFPTYISTIERCNADCPPFYKLINHTRVLFTPCKYHILYFILIFCYLICSFLF